MSHTFTTEVSDEETAAIAISLKPLRDQINRSPALLSFLYDIDLLPEQIRLYVNVTRLAAICMLWDKAFPESAEANQKEKAK